MKVLDFIRKITGKRKKPEIEQPKTRYQELVESIDDLDLCHMFVTSITPELREFYKEHRKEATTYTLQTAMYDSWSWDIAERFFSSVDMEILDRVYNVLDNQSGKFKIIIDTRGGKGSCVSAPGKFPIEIFIREQYDLNLVYDIVHELTHTLDMENGDTPTRQILGEVAPQCMEALFSEFLHDLTEDDLLKYGMTKYKLDEDIRTRKKMTFVTRLNNAETLEHDRKADRVLESRYMLAQIYTTHFMKIPKEERGKRLGRFIECVANDDFEGANAAFGIRIKKSDKLQRRFLIDDTIIDAEETIGARQGDEIIFYSKKHGTVRRTIPKQHTFEETRGNQPQQGTSANLGVR